MHQVTIDLGHVMDVTGTGITFSGEQAGDGATYTVSAGTTQPGQAAFPNQAACTQWHLHVYRGTRDGAFTCKARRSAAWRMGPTMPVERKTEASDTPRSSGQ